MFLGEQPSDSWRGGHCGCVLRRAYIPAPACRRRERRWARLVGVCTSSRPEGARCEPARGVIVSFPSRGSRAFRWGRVEAPSGCISLVRSSDFPGWRSWFRLERSFPNLDPQGASESPAAHKAPGALCHPGRAPKPRRSGALGTVVHAPPPAPSNTHTQSGVRVSTAPRTRTPPRAVSRCCPRTACFQTPNSTTAPQSEHTAYGG